MFSKIWTIIFLPFLFTLIGNEVNFQKINPSMIGRRIIPIIFKGDLYHVYDMYNIKGLGTACIIIALVFRMLATFFSAMFSGFNHKEKLFICFAWIPKATVQVNIYWELCDLKDRLWFLSRLRLLLDQSLWTWLELLITKLK